MTILEPPRNNSGIPQGKLLKRHRLPKNDLGEFYHWRELNVAMNLPIYGRVYRLTNCDKFTRDFLESEGIVLNEGEVDPEDPYLEQRITRETLREYKTPSSYDARRQTLENDRKVLRFYAIWDDRSEMYGDCRNFNINYYLADDTLEVTEIHKPNDGYDPFAQLIKRGPAPKTMAHIPRDYPTIYLEPTPQVLKEYFRPIDLKIGNTVVINGRKFLIYDCDQFTKAWYHENFGYTEFTPIDVSLPEETMPKLELPPYNDFGMPDDSLMQMKCFVPKPPKTDVPKLVDYGTKQLRYSACLESPNAEDAIRKFLLIYNLSNDMISVREIGVKNSGFPRQKFLKNCRCLKPGATMDEPDYYGPLDFAPGSKIILFGHRFRLQGVDTYVIKFMEANPHLFPNELIDAWKQTMQVMGNCIPQELHEELV
ncbi:EF-hand domain-containing protein 1 [Cichlidogyrus casuarinus]|uniref:EF-hand domain-containing protein 1 n=1 Tax=Cichlidogyrus casuarinus TaxID=1844966 RepID=A0ABD2Q7S5_9PLAT